jgi:hypothetical protein
MVLRRVVTLMLTFARRSRRAEQPQDAELRLELCGLCGRDFVNPVGWEPVGPERWRILLRCGECGTWRDVTVTNAVARRYDVELNRCAVRLAAVLGRMDRERMLGQVEAMTIALELGLIDAADFAVTRSAWPRAELSPACERRPRGPRRA